MMKIQWLAPLLALTALTLVACDGDETPKTAPAVLNAAIECEDVSGQDYPIVKTVSVTITDAERDLLDTSIEAYVNGLRMEGISDPDADEIYTWSPPAAWDPPMVCRNEFTILVRAADASGLKSEETLLVQK